MVVKKIASGCVSYDYRPSPHLGRDTVTVQNRGIKHPKLTFIFIYKYKSFFSTFRSRKMNCHTVTLSREDKFGRLKILSYLCKFNLYIDESIVSFQAVCLAGGHHPEGAAHFAGRPQRLRFETGRTFPLQCQPSFSSASVFLFCQSK